MVYRTGLVQMPSRYSVGETPQRLELALATRGLQVFARVDHRREAEQVGMKMRPTKLLIFGRPTAGTPLMVAAPTLAIDLPLKALVTEDEAGKVWLTCNSPEYLQGSARRAIGIDPQSGGSGVADGKGCGIMLPLSGEPVAENPVARFSARWERRDLIT